MARQVSPHCFLGEPPLGVKGHVCVHAHLITGPIWRVPTVKQTSVLEDMGFPRQMYFGHRSLDQLSRDNYFPLLVTTAKPDCCSGGDRLCILLVVGKYLAQPPDLREEGATTTGIYPGIPRLLFHSLHIRHTFPNGKPLFAGMVYSSQTENHLTKS